MTEKKKTDRLFRESFRDFEVPPPPAAWERLERELRQKKKRRLVPLWFKISGAAALLVVFTLLYFPQRNTFSTVTPVKISSESTTAIAEPTKFSEPRGTTPAESNSAPPRTTTVSANPAIKDEYKSHVQRIVNNGTVPGQSLQKSVPQQQAARNRFVKKVMPGSTALNPESYASQGAKTEVPDSSRNPIQTSPETKILSEKIITSPPLAEKETIAEAVKDSSSIAPQPSATLEELVAEKPQTPSASKDKKWQIAPVVAPVYFSSVSGGSPLDARFKNNQKSFVPTMSYGALVSYGVSKKVSLRTGIHRVDLSYETNDVLISQNDNARMMEHVRPNERGRLIQVDTKVDNPENPLGRTVMQYGGSVRQSMAYFEVPVEMGYRVVDKRIKLDVVGGLSTMFLTENEVAVSTSGTSLVIGEAANLSSIHFTTNFGIGVRYGFLKDFEASFEPAFKYQFNAYTGGSGDFRPYFFGLYSGIRYQF